MRLNRTLGSLEASGQVLACLDRCSPTQAWFGSQAWSRSATPTRSIEHLRRLGDQGCRAVATRSIARLRPCAILRAWRSLPWG